MQSQSAKQFAPMIGDDQKVEVSVEEGGAVIRLSTWVEGLGWSCQKTLRIDEGLVDDLQRALTAARKRIYSTKSLADQGSGTVISFPKIS
ncbi:MAG: hypothetical protein IPM63_00605 [Acidobacteriota bacterium]|nr:MAG: hypothetical protein IPM63_00605 [Acidobacteriota bacterium]